MSSDGCSSTVSLPLGEGDLYPILGPHNVLYWWNRNYLWVLEWRYSKALTKDDTVRWVWLVHFCISHCTQFQAFLHSPVFCHCSTADHSGISAWWDIHCCTVFNRYGMFFCASAQGLANSSMSLQVMETLHSVEHRRSWERKERIWK